MGLWIGVALLIALVWWLFLPRRRTARAPEDDVRSPIDRDELAEAERDLERGPRGRPPGAARGPGRGGGGGRRRGGSGGGGPGKGGPRGRRQRGGKPSRTHSTSTP